jgi:site-specific recombinase XerD
MDVVVVIAKFKHQLAARGYAPSTVRCYSDYLTYFKRYLLEHEITDIKAVTPKVVTDYQALVMSKPYAAETQALHIRPVKRLFEYLIEESRLLIDPTEGIVETRRKGRKLAPVLTVEQMQKLLQQPNLSLRSQIRDRAIMEVLYCSAIRLDELLHLEVYHVDFTDKVLFIRKGKGRRQRVVPLGKQALSFLKEYLTHIRPRWVKKQPRQRRLFLTHSGLALTGGTVRSFIRRYRMAAKITTPVSAHTFRRSCATHLVQQGADIRYVQKLLGHADLKTTQIYTRLAPMDVKQTHQRTHPNVKKDRTA